MGRKRNYTDDQFIESVKTSLSIAQTLRKLNLSETGSNYKLAKLRIRNLNIDISHFKGQSWSKGTTHNHNKKIPLNKILVENSNYTSHECLKKRLFKEKLLENKCYECGLTEWMGKPISLQMDHINGKNLDHRIENLRILCPNCHSQTPTYGSKNREVKKKKYYCCNCNKQISKDSKSGLCSPCFNKTLNNSIKNRKVKDRPSKEQLLKEIEETNYCAVGRKYGVSDNAIRKWLK